MGMILYTILLIYEYSTNETNKKANIRSILPLTKIINSFEIHSDSLHLIKLIVSLTNEILTTGVVATFPKWINKNDMNKAKTNIKRLNTRMNDILKNNEI